MVVKEKVLSRLLNMDNIIFMRNCKDNEFDVGIVDPEYLDKNENMTIQQEENQSKTGGRMIKSGASFQDFSGKPTSEYFYHLFRITKYQIIFGGNYFTDILDQNGKPYLYPNNNWFIWNKQIADANWSMHEMAWTSIENNARSFRYSPMGKVADWHPTSKPIDVYRYLIENYIKPLEKKLKRRVNIIDTNTGSAASRIAAFILGVNFTGLEIKRKFFDLSNKDFEMYKEKNSIFLPYDEEDFSVF